MDIYNDIYESLSNSVSGTGDILTVGVVLLVIGVAVVFVVLNK